MVYPVQNNQSTHDYRIFRDIRKAKQELIRQDMSDADTIRMRQEIQRAEQAAQNGKYTYARQIAGEVLEQLTDKIDFGETETENKKEFSNKHEVDSRKYQDDSPDSIVSYQTPTEVNEYQDDLAVRSHEGQHVRRERWKAMQNGEIVHTQVRYNYSIDMNGKRYLKGAKTIVQKRKPADYKSSPLLKKPEFSISG